MCEMCQTWTCLFVAEKVTYYCINKCNFFILCYINGKNIMRTRKYLSIIQYSYKVRPKKNICVFIATCQKNLGSVGINFFFFFIIIIDKTGNSRFRYLIFENSGKMTNYAVFLPSLLSISTKS